MVDSIHHGSVQYFLLTDLVYIHSARRPKRVEGIPFEGSVPYVDIQTLESGNPRKYAEGKDYVLEENDLVMVKDGHRSGKVFHAQKGVAASTLTILSPKCNRVQIDYIYCYLAYCYEDFQSRKRGSTIAHLDMNYLKRLLIPLPDVAKQKEIAEKYNRLELLVKKLKTKALRLVELSQKLESSELKESCNNLTQQGEMILKSWLHQLFD